ncbi:hypothetical protein NPIL_124901 [Nephila pilipes]|uniref:Uncharacterized protein n=1 Tax=Nephila pilipes TaxID=299642 RepID=A0A8X6UX70_NEPPI|nr:hypothetical protein NPIL_124901 [Nephila pilipes]
MWFYILHFHYLVSRLLSSSEVNNRTQWSTGWMVSFRLDCHFRLNQKQAGQVLRTEKSRVRIAPQPPPEGRKAYPPKD